MKSFQPNCTFPTTIPSGFVQGPNIRGTVDIVWGCISVIILSTWTVLHLNVPPDIKPKTKWEGFRKHCYLLGRKLAWMGIMLAFPEYVVAVAATNLFVCRINHPRLAKLAEEDGVPWTLTHTILANMGGIAVRFHESEVSGEKGEHDTVVPQGDSGTNSTEHLENCRKDSIVGEVSTVAATPECPLDAQPVADETCARTTAMMPVDSSTALDSATSPDASTTPPVDQQSPEFLTIFRDRQEQYLKGLGECVWRPFEHHMKLAAHVQPTQHWIQANRQKYNAEQLAPLHGNIWIPDSKQLALARAFGIVERLPNIPKEEIDDKSKIDGLIRTITLVQAIWLAIELIARAIKGVPSTALEISTVAFAACAILIYAIEWLKPYDMAVPFYIDTKHTVSLQDFTVVAESSPIVFIQARRYYISLSCVHQVVEGTGWRKEHIDRLFILFTIIAITLYGGIHLFAWNLEFPTRIESILWRASALTIAIAPTISALLVLLEEFVRHRTDRLSIISVTILAPAYLGARVYIIVESFRSLYFLHADAFVAMWSNNAPHIG